MKPRGGEADGEGEEEYACERVAGGEGENQDQKQNDDVEAGLW